MRGRSDAFGMPGMAGIPILGNADGTRLSVLHPASPRGARRPGFRTAQTLPSDALVPQIGEEQMVRPSLRAGLAQEDESVVALAAPPFPARVRCWRPFGHVLGRTDVGALEELIRRLGREPAVVAPGVLADLVRDRRVALALHHV